ncbi:S41 family peptidase [Candidatus Berkelbacteria bacterium]|nr:S41 family peptidase [Candidatus Berkelbacteria bacterium]
MSKFKLFLFFLVFGLAAFGAGLGLGQKTKAVKVAESKPAFDLTLLSDVRKILQERFITEPQSQDLLYGAIRGLVESLKDPYTVFATPEETKQFMRELKGEFDGIGAEIAKENGDLIIVAPLEDSPAAKAGLKPRDKILKIDNLKTANLSLDEAIGKIRGPAGSSVSLSIQHEGAPNEIELKIKRQKIKVKSVKAETCPKKVNNNCLSYLKISVFSDDTTLLAKRAADEILAKKSKGLVLDLRNNPGGYLDGAVDLASLFLEDKVVVKEEGRSNQDIKEEIKTTSRPRLKDIKLVVLVNKGSASASEIVAGALQDYSRAKLLGETTFGKGTVQDLEELEGGASLRLTVAKWLTPNGKSINKEGIKPDIFVEEKEETKDLVLDKAWEELAK